MTSYFSKPFNLFFYLFVKLYRFQHNIGIIYECFIYSSVNSVLSYGAEQLSYGAIFWLNIRNWVNFGVWQFVSVF